MPHLKQFVKGPGHADGYEGLEVKYIQGHLPELWLLNPETGEETKAEDHDLRKLNPEGKMGDVVADIAAMHAYFAAQGFVRKAGVAIPEAMANWREGMVPPTTGAKEEL